MPVAQPPRPRLILDCDPGVDDAVAIALALRFADVAGITTVGGNVALEHTTRNAIQVCDLLGRPDVPVHAGHDLPLSGSLAHRAGDIHGNGGLGAVTLPDATRAATSDDAVAWLIETVRNEEGLWLVPTGPLTNVATAIRQAPDIVEKLAGISWMGGSTGSGNTTAAAEFNAWIDPEAAALVFAAGHPRLAMVGLNITHQVLLDDQWIESFDPTPTRVSRVFKDLLAYYRARQQAYNTLAGAAVHDALAVAWVTHPHLLGSARRTVLPITDAGPTRGMTLTDLRARRSPADTNADVVEWADPEGLRAAIAEAIR